MNSRFLSTGSCTMWITIIPPRNDYENFPISIQTKFDLFMDGHKEDGSHANEDMNKLLEHFNQQTLFVSMIFDV